jgi:acyl-CoA synthetase (AMP-forming)/AMP-acid ligase II
MSAVLLHDLLDRSALERPQAAAIAHGASVMSFAELDAASRRIAGWLTERGVARGDRVVIALPTDLLVPALIYGCSRAGAVFSLSSDQSPAVAIAHVLDDAEPALLITDHADGRLLAQSRAIPHAGLGELRHAAEHGAVAASLTAPLAVDPICLIYTSGSTGAPKAVVSTHAQVVFAVTAIQSQLEYFADDVVYCALPLSFDYGMYQVFLATLAGARIQLASAADAGALLLRQLGLYGATVLPAVPGLAAGLAKLLSRPGAQAPSLRLLTNTGAAMAPDVLCALRQRIPGLQVQLMFGLTECKRASIMPKDEDLTRPGACGRALPGTEILTVDAAGKPTQAGEVGEIVVRGPNVMAGYWRRPALTAQRFPRDEGLFAQLRTGDYGWLDEDGFLYFVGRTDDQYKEHGTRVNISEVETAALRVPGVEAAAVLAPHSGADGATLFAVTALRPHEVLARLSTELDVLKAPRVCLVVQEIPLTRNGKVDRTALRGLLSEAAYV